MHPNASCLLFNATLFFEEVSEMQFQKLILPGVMPGGGADSCEISKPEKLEEG